MGVFGVLQVIFITLKLIGLITWSWWAVFSPLLISLALYIGVFLWAYLDD